MADEATNENVFCNAVYDGYLCWPPTPAGKVATQNCPPIPQSDPRKLAFRRCNPDGLWIGKNPNESTHHGWTNYTPCFTPLVQTLLNQVYDDEDSDQAQEKFDIAHNTRNLEMVGFSTSLITLLISLSIFTRYRSLRNQRTCIHICLFITMTVQMTIRLIIYIDQALTRNNTSKQYDDEYETLKGLNNLSYLCETSYIFLEYSISSMLMWMFVEGLYLHSMVTANALRDRVSNETHYIIGWVLPVISTGIWATLSAIHYQAESVNYCWYGYNFSGLYWILQVPRMAVVTVNFVFLLNILRVVIVKQRRIKSNDMVKIGKAVKAALILLPLLGITNFLNMIEPPLDGSVWKFRLWSYGSHTLRSFQGFFIAIIYCFTNAEVRQVISRHFRNYRAVRADRRRRREDCMREAAMAMGALGEQQLAEQRRPRFGMMRLRSSERTQNVSETEFGASISQENTGMTSRISETTTVSASVHTASEVSQTGQTARYIRYRPGTPRLNTRALVTHNIPTQVPPPKNQRDTKFRLGKLRMKSSRSTKSTPNMSKIGLGAAGSHDERSSGPARYIPHHHGVLVHNIPLPYHTRPMPLKGKRKPKNPRDLMGLKGIRPTMSTSTPNMSGIHYAVSTSQDVQSFETIATSHLHNKRMPYN